MLRTADYTIKGFLYQFNKTLVEILSAGVDTPVVVEGLIEDIDVLLPDGTTATQCKYHESIDHFTPSLVYKPVLQMINHFHTNQAALITYVLFVHFPLPDGAIAPTIEKTDIEAALASKNKDFRTYVTIKDAVDIDTFFARFKFQHGCSYDEIVTKVQDLLRSCGIPAGDVDILAYPNAINELSNLSIKHDEVERTITKRHLLSLLGQIKKTAITRWTLASSSRKELLDARRKQLKLNLAKNARLRYFLIHSAQLDDFDTGIVSFISDILEKYHCKQLHVCTPVFCVDAPQQVVDNITYQLHEKRIVSSDGMVGGRFVEDRFFREPLKKKVNSTPNYWEFALRIISLEGNVAALNRHKPDDLFVLGDGGHSEFDTTNVNVEALSSQTLKEIKYVMGVSNGYE